MLPNRLHRQPICRLPIREQPQHQTHQSELQPAGQPRPARSVPSAAAGAAPAWNCCRSHPAFWHLLHWRSRQQEELTSLSRYNHQELRLYYHTRLYSTRGPFITSKPRTNDIFRYLEVQQSSKCSLTIIFHDSVYFCLCRKMSDYQNIISRIWREALSSCDVWISACMHAFMHSFQANLFLELLWKCSGGIV